MKLIKFPYFLGYGILCLSKLETAFLKKNQFPTKNDGDFHFRILGMASILDFR
jgi:hypothetical protein